MKVFIKNINDFGTVGIQGVHQVVESEGDIDAAVERAEKDGFKNIFFYFIYPSNWMNDMDFRSLVSTARSITS